MPDIINQNGTWVLQPDANFSSLELETIDLTDGSWNHIDINSTISSLGFSDGANKVVTNAIGGGTVNQFANSNQNMARWYKNLVDSDGVQLTTGDNFIFISTIQPLSSSNPAPFGFGCGISVNPIGTGSNTNATCTTGSAFEQSWLSFSITNEQIGSNQGRKHEYDCNVNSHGGVNMSNLLTSSIATYVQNFGFTNGGASVSTNNVDGRVSKNNMTINSLTSSLFLQVGFGARQNSTSALSGAEHKQIIKFKVIRLKP